MTRERPAAIPRESVLFVMVIILLRFCMLYSIRFRTPEVKPKRAAAVIGTDNPRPRADTPSLGRVQQLQHAADRGDRLGRLEAVHVVVLEDARERLDDGVERAVLLVLPMLLEPALDHARLVRVDARILEHALRQDPEFVMHFLSCHHSGFSHQTDRRREPFTAAPPTDPC